eukprot:CFRG1684T1
MGHLQKIVKALVGLLFVFVGTIKFTDQFMKKQHLEMKEQFVNFAMANSQLIFNLTRTEVAIDPDAFRVVVGAVEVLCGSLICFSESDKSATLILMATMVGATWTLALLGESILPPLLVLASLSLHYHLTYGMPVNTNTKKEI